MYHPRVFQKNIKKTNITNIEPVVVEKKTIIPEATLYEEPLVKHTKPVKKHITVFGFSRDNFDSVMEKVKEVCHVNHIEQGKNWINVVTDDTTKLLKLNLSRVNGEIIGVYREHGNVIVDDDNIFIRKQGVLSQIIAYFFGQ